MKRMRRVSWLCVSIFGWLPATTCALGEPIEMREGLAVSAVGSGGRSPVITDAVQAFRARDRWTTPSEGDTIAVLSGHKKVWKKIASDAEGQFEDGALYGGYAVWRFESDADKVMILDAAGHSTVWVNGVIRAGDHYEYGTIRTPVEIKQGANELMFLCGRGRLRATLREPDAPIALDPGNTTLPHLLEEHAEDDAGSEWGAIVIANATEKAGEGLTITCATPDGVAETTQVAEMLPASVFKAPFRIPGVRGHAGETLDLTLTLRHGDTTLDTRTVPMRVMTTDGPNNRTFRSRVDGSVQYYAERPAVEEERAVILTLHGASVEASGQAAVYTPKGWARIVAPTNRGKFGFDWEDWGRIDAIEVLERVSPDRKAILTGHSMGGHGSWQLASHYPDRFLAVGPSAGWVSFESYTGLPSLRAYGAAGRILERAASPSDTLQMKRNFTNLPAFILHGSEDDNVPVEQAFIMQRELGGISPGLTLHSQLGAGHWWGNECCDWPAMMAFFKQKLDADTGAPDRVRFTTTNPGINASCEWVTIDQQTEALSPSRVDLSRNLEARRIEGKSENVDRFTLDLSAFDGAPVTLVIDEDPIEVDADTSTVSLFQGRRGWDIDDEDHPLEKGPVRNGPFKAAFDRDCVLVYATHGDEDENLWAMRRARYDSELFLARGNGALRVMSDDDYLKAGHEGHVVLYGHAEANSAWDTVLGEGCPVRVQRGRIIIDNQKTIEGDDLGAMFCYPVEGSASRLAGVIAPTGSSAGIMLDRQLIFFSGVHYPDLFIMRSSALDDGHKSIVGAGFFGNDWTTKRGDFVWTE